MAKTFKNFIAGKWVRSATGKTFENRNPADTRDLIGNFPDSDARDIEAAVRSAANGFARWSRTPAPARGDVLKRVGGRLAQRVGPFRVGTIGLLGGALFMALYGVVPTGGAMFAVAMVHAVNDGLTVSSTGVAVGMVVPAERQAGAQGVLGGFETLTAGITAAATGALYEHFGRATAYGVAAAAMVVLVAVGALLARQSWRDQGRDHATTTRDRTRPRVGVL